MLIVCPNCATSYDVDVASLRPNGRKVRCVRCKTIWHAELSHADRLMAAAEALAPVRRAVDAVAEAVAEEAAEDAAAEQAASSPHMQTPAEAWFDGPEDDPSAGGAANDPFAVDSPSIAPTDPDADNPLDAEDDEATDAEQFEDV